MFASDELVLFVWVFRNLLIGLLKVQNLKFFRSEHKITLQKLTCAEIKEHLINEVG